MRVKTPEKNKYVAYDERGLRLKDYIGGKMRFDYSAVRNILASKLYIGW